MTALAIDNVQFRQPYSPGRQWSRVSSVIEMSPQFRQMAEELSELAELPENWNGYGSPRLQPAAISEASNLIGILEVLHMPVPQFVPVSGGGIQLEWHNNKCELEVEIRADGTMEFLIVDETGTMREGRFPLSYTSLLYALADWFKREKPSVSLL
jgi:hypothetical protein